MTFRSLVLGISLMFSLEVFGQDDPDPSQIYIESLEYQGAGCEAGSAVHNLSSDREAMTILFDNYIVSSSDVAGTQAQKSCRVKIRMAVPAGWSFSVFGADYRGFASLAQGIRGSQASRYSFGQGAPVRLDALELTGPLVDDYIQTTDLPLSPLGFSSCQARSHILTLDTDIRVVGREPFRNGAASQQGLMTVDSIDGQVEESFALVWKPCQRPSVEARCSVIGESRTGQRHTFWGLGYARNDQAAKAKALAKARQRCNRVKQNNPRMRFSCTADREQCTATRS